MPEDILVVDREFRDSIATLEEYGLIAKIPCFLEKGSQHDTISANESRLVTCRICKWLNKKMENA